jgi:hypothetical protein
MSDTLSGAAAALRHTGAQLEDASAALRALDPGAGVFGDGPGRLGALGQDLHRQWQRCLDARAREAQTHAARLAEVADAVRRAGAGYAEMDDNAHRRHPEVP